MKKFTTALFLALTVLAQGQTYRILNNGFLRSGNGSQNSVNASGNLEQPFYFNGSVWRKLTYSTFPLDIEWAVDGVGTNNWNRNGTIVQNPTLTSPTYDFSGHTLTNLSNGEGYGIVKVAGNVTIGGKVFLVENTYNLPQGQGYIEIKTKITNLSNMPTANVRLWVGTRDDWVGDSDGPTKNKGNIINGAFVNISSISEQSKALRVSTNAEAILFYSNSPRAYTSHASCCSFTNSTGINPQTGAITATNDGSYALFVRFNDLEPGQSDEVIWYYAGGTLAQINNIVTAVAQASGSFQNRTCTGATYNATSNVAATGYWVAVPDGSTAPTAAQIKLGVNYGNTTVVASSSGSMSANASTPFTISNLAGQNGPVDYDFYFVTESPDPNNNQVLVFSSIISEGLTTVDQTAPTVVTRNISITLNAQGQASIQPSDIDNGSTDNCGTTLTYSLNKTSFTCADGPSQNVTLTVTDGYGNVGTGNATVSITNSASSPLAVTNSLCGSQSLLWATWNNITSTSGQGTFGNLGVSVSVTHSAGGLSTTSSMYNHSTFPSQFTVPNTTSLRNDLAGTFTFCFSQPVTNPQVAFSSIGNPSNSVGITSSVPYQIVWNGQGVVYNNSTSFTGTEGFNIVSFPGTHQCITLVYGQNESYANLAFGFENFNCAAPTICAGQSVTLTATGGSSYQWSPATGLDLTNTASVVASPTATTTYTVIDPTNPCSSPQTITVTVPVPTVPIADATQYFCPGYTIANLVASVPQGQSVRWFSAATGGLPMLTSTSLVSGTTYYAESIEVTCGVSPSRTAVLALSQPAAAQASSGPVGMLRGTPAIIDPSLAINQQQGIVDGALVFVSSGFVSGDILDYPGVLPSGITKAYNSGTGVLTFAGTFQPSDLQTVLRGVTINTTSNNAQDRTVTFNAGSALPFGANNHFYRFVTAPGISWTDARNAAAQTTYNGLQGYLTTVTSTAENQFVASRLAGQGWMGASDAAVEDVWRWVTGPESGTQFWQGRGSTGAIVSGGYNNWASGEPNDFGTGEDYAHFLSNGQWNDFPHQLSSISGYVVEFGGMPNDPCVILSSEKIVNVTISTPPTVTTNTSFTVTSTSAGFAGEVTNDGNAIVSDRGFVLSTTSAPTTSNTKLSIGTGLGVFNGTLSGLLPSTQYFIRAFATNSVTTSYGNEISFYTRPVDITGVTSTNFSATHQANVICYGASTTLTSAGTSGVVYWYTASCGGTQVGTGNTLTVSPTTTTTYYARNFNNNLFSDGCASITVVVRPQLVAPAIVGAETICWNSQATGLTGTQATGGSSATVTTGFSYQWQYSEDFGGTWQNIVGQNNPASLLPGFLYQTTQYRLLATDLGSPACTTNIASNVIEVIVRDPFTPSVVSTTNPNNTVCQAGSVNLTATPTIGGSGPSFLYQWQRSFDSINWVDEGPALQNTTAYTVATVTTDTYYRLIAFDLGTPACGSVFSTNAVLVSVQTAVTQGSISGAQHICAGTAPTAAIASVTVGSGLGLVSYRWEASTDNGQTWSTIAGAFGDSYQPGVLQTTTDYRRFAVSTYNSAACESLLPTNVVRIVVDQAAVASITAAGTASCVNAAVPVPGVTINHGTAVWTHDGQGAISGSLTAPVYTPVAADAGNSVTLTLTVTGTAICLNVPAVDTYVIVVDRLPVATAGGSATICENSTHTLVGAASANGTILWTQNGAGSLTGATTLTPTYTAAAGDAGQMVILTMTVSSTNTCSPATASATYTVNVDQLPAASAGGTQAICSLASAVVSGASSARGTILWTHNGSGSLSDATTLIPTYTAGAADAGTTVTLTMTVTSTNVCGPQTATATYSVVVRPDFVPATFVNQMQDLCYNTGASQITATAATGGTGPYAYQWQVSTDSTTWSNISAATSLTYTPTGTFTSSRFYRILSTDLGTPTCGTTLAGAANVKLLVRAPLTPPVLAAVTICQGTSTTLTPSLALGGRSNFTYQWQQSANGTSGWSNIGTASSSIAFTTPNLTGTSFYRVIARDENVTLNNLTYISCGSTFSQAIRVTVAAATTTGAISGDETTCAGSVTAAIASVTAGTGSGTISYRWEQSTDNGTTWVTVLGSVSATYAQGVLTQTTMYRRFTVSTQNGTACESVPTDAVTKIVEQLAVFTAVGSNVSTNTDLGLPAAVVNYTVTATAVTPVTLTYAFTGATTATGNGTGSGAAFGIGTTIVTVTATTQCGVSTSTFTVEVIDNENPVITAGSDLNVSTTTATTGCAMPVTVTSPVATDNAPGVQVSYVLTGATTGSGTSITGVSFNVGTTVITWTATDASGNTASAMQSITVLDQTAPVISIPANIAVTVDANSCASSLVIVVAPLAADQCDAVVSVGQRSDNLALTASYPVGITSITWTSVDLAGNIATPVVQTVTVVDTIAPYVTTQLDSLVYVDENSCVYYWENWRADLVIIDNCGVQATINSVRPQNLFLNKGVHIINFTLSDANGNQRVYNHRVRVVDTISPKLTNMPANITAFASANCETIVTWVDPTPSDNCVNFVMSSTYSPGDVFSLGANPVSYLVTDASGNVITRSFTITVLDTVKPLIPAQAATLVLSAQGTATLGLSQVLTSAGITDNCGLDTAFLSKTSFECADLGANIVAITATDVNGNTRVLTVVVTVVDLTSPIVNVPSTVTLYSSATQCNAIASWTGITATDNCGLATVTTSIASGSVFTPGTTNVAVVATDAAGNQTSTSFQVIVLDTINPVWNALTSNILVGSCSSAVTYTSPAAVDNCGAVSIVQTAGLPSGSVFPIGVTTNTFVATDASGNSATTSFTVTVQGSTFTFTPTQTTYCNVDMVLDLMPAGASNLTFSGAGVSGTSSFNPLNAGLGNHVITYTHVDTLGCQTIGTFVITVYATPTIPVIQRMTSTTLKVVDTYATYQWRRNGVNIAGATQQIYSVSSSGIYTVVVGNGNCTSVSDPYGFGVTIGEDELELNELRVQPNPNNGQFTLIHSLPIDEVHSVQIVDMLGRVVYKVPLHDLRMSFDVRTIAQGQYLIVVRSASNVITKPIVIQH